MTEQIQLTEMDIDALDTLASEHNQLLDGWCSAGEFEFDSLKHESEWVTSLFWLRGRGYVESRILPDYVIDEDDPKTDDCCCDLIAQQPHPLHGADDVEWRITEAGRLLLAER